VQQVSRVFGDFMEVHAEDIGDLPGGTGPPPPVQETGSVRADQEIQTGWKLEMAVSLDTPAVGSTKMEAFQDDLTPAFDRE